MESSDSEVEVALGSELGDRLSELPDSVIHPILSFLPMRQVVSTALLSKRWKNLWTTVPCLNFCDDLSKLDNGADSFRNFVNRALMFWKGAKLLKFKIDIAPHFDRSLTSDMDLWVRFAMENKVEELSIHLTYEPEDNFEDWANDDVRCSKKEIFYAPQCLNSCSSITKLSLVGCNLRIRGPPSWNQLKSLRIDGFWYSERVINRILLGSPRLEVFELRLVDSLENLNIRSASLKKLKIEKYLYYDDCAEASMYGVLRICCPGLEILELWGVLYPKYVFTHVSSLTDVTLGFDGKYMYPCGNEKLEETFSQIFSAIQHVDKVTLSCWCVQVLGALQKKYKFFPNLKMLSVFFEGRSSLKPRSCSGAEKYVGLETKLSKSFLLQLHTVDITSPLYDNSTIRILEILSVEGSTYTYAGTSPLFDTSTIGFIEFLLKEGSMLQKLMIRVEGASFRSADSWFKIAEALLCLPRSSPTAKVILKKC